MSKLHSLETRCPKEGGGRSDDAAAMSEPHWSENPTALLGEEG